MAPPKDPRSPLERVLARVEVSEHGCWIWAGAKNDTGYGYLNVNGRMRRTHVIVWEHYHGPVPAGMEIDHVCRVPACCNPDQAHTEAVTTAENQRRGQAACRPLVCVHGHWKLGANVIVRKNGDRECRACENERQRRKKARRKAAP